MDLLSLPDELLSTIILETMWATTTKPSNPPDLLMYERRVTNHPSIEHEKVAFVGQICGRLRSIAQPLMSPAQLWEDSDARVELNYGHPDVSDAPASLSDPAIRAIACSRGQGVFLPQLPTATLERLSELSVSQGSGGGGCVIYSDEVLSSIGSCKRLQSLTLEAILGFAGGVNRLLANLAALRTLQSLALDNIYTTSDLFHPPPLALGHTWQAPLVRLEVNYSAIPLAMFVELMSKVAVTLQVAIFKHREAYSYATLESSTAAAASFPQLWRLDISFGIGAHPRYRDEQLANPSTSAGRQQLAHGTPIVIWKAAPALEYFECTEQIVVKTQKELDEISELKHREGMKRLRIKLVTWEGDKGDGWTREVKQDVTVG